MQDVYKVDPLEHPSVTRVTGRLRGKGTHPRQWALAALIETGVEQATRVVPRDYVEIVVDGLTTVTAAVHGIKKNERARAREIGKRLGRGLNLTFVSRD